MLSAIFDVALGLILVFLVMSVVASSVSEYLGNVLHRRSWNLERFIESVLLGTGIRLIEDFYQRTLLAAQLQNGRRPSYLKAEDFAQALIDSLTAKYLHPEAPDARAMAVADPTLDEWAVIVDKLWAGKMTIDDKLKKLTWVERIRQWWRSRRALPPLHIGNPLPLAQVLSAMIVQAKGDSQQVRKQLETWYDNSMNRVSGWYKGQTQIILLVIGLGLAAMLNVDTLTIANSLLQNPAIRAVVDDAAKNMANSPSNSPTTPVQVETYLAKLNLPIGWPDPNMPNPVGLEWYLHKLLGILITGFAVSQGAPFWFDLLNKVVNMRSGGLPPATAQQSAAINANTAAVLAAATTPTPPPVQIINTPVVPVSSGPTDTPPATPADNNPPQTPINPPSPPSNNNPPSDSSPGLG